MSTSSDTVQFIVDQAGLGPALTSRKMFGEYALYVDGKVVALVCDDQLFLKPTPAVRAELRSVNERPPYPGAKPHFLLADELDDRALLQRVLRLTAQELPEPKPRRAAGARSLKARQAR